MSRIYSQFQSLVSTPGLTVVTILTVNSDGTSRAETLGGTTITVDGDSVAAGNKAFVRNGEIVREAPNLTIGQFTV